MSQLLRAPDGEGAGGSSPAPAAPSSPAPAAPSSPAPSAPAPVSTSPDIDRDMESARKVFEFDYFGPADGDPAEPLPGDAPPASPTPGAAAPGKVPEASLAAAPPAPTKSPEVQALERQIAELNGRVEGFTRAQPQPAPQGDAAPEVEVPAYEFAIPEKLAGLLNSEDPKERMAGMAHLSRGIAQVTHREVVKSIRAEVGAILPHVIQAHLARSQGAQTVQTEFYGKYKELNSPELRPLVANVASRLAAELKVRSWTPEFGDKVAERVRAVLTRAAPAPTPSPSAPPASQAPRLTQGGGVRPGGGPSPPATSQMDEMMDLLR